MDIPEDITKLLSSFYCADFEFDRNHKQFEVSEDGLTVSTLTKTLGDGRPSIRFGEYLYHRYGDKFECTFRLDDGGNSGLLIGFITPQFSEFEHHEDSSSCAHSDFACLAAGNGWFKIDTKCGFKCDDAKNRSHNSFNYMTKNGETLTVSVNMQTKIGKIGIYTVLLPDIVGIVICSNAAHKITVIHQQ